jgi:uridine kinase
MLQMLPPCVGSNHRCPPRSGPTAGTQRALVWWQWTRPQYHWIFPCKLRSTGLRPRSDKSILGAAHWPQSAASTAAVRATSRERGFTVAVINADGWLRLPHERFSATGPAEHFYTHAFRFEDMFAKLVVPLRERRRVSVEADFAEETANAYRKMHYEFSDIDIILLEGIYLLKRTYQHHHDISIWIDCSFGTALKRAVGRAQEGLTAEETVRAYKDIYFPAQELHFLRDAPREAASLILENDRY